MSRRRKKQNVQEELTPALLMKLVSGRDDLVYNEQGVQSLKRVRKVIESLGLPLINSRKFNGILTAIEMQIEDGRYDLATVERLLEALVALADHFDLGAGRKQIVFAIEAFRAKL